MKIEGKNPILEALKTGATIDKLLVEKGTNHDIISKARKCGVKVQFVDKFLLDKQSSTGHHQGFIAYTTDFVYCEVEDIVNNPKSIHHFIVLLDGITDPHNLGSILRVCECAGVDGVIIPKNRSVSVNETVIKVSAGACSHIKVAKVTNLNTCIEQLKKLNIFVYCADMDGVSMYDTDLRGDIALVIGSEGEGVSALTKKLCDASVSIKLLGNINSLNASVACGIVCYEVVRQRCDK
ncbi:MAG: 23S rRNA (guanosine(2251)-2'-O)-methyltransferase RlmB [Clostridia bacterium]|nr:23S rRNA (guanosine(2251)-2'-O)-methyltransferase RlmB [Clostridia bacterium]